MLQSYPTDENLLLAIQRGECSIVASLVERHHSPLLGYLYQMTDGDRAPEYVMSRRFLKHNPPMNGGGNRY